MTNLTHHYRTPHKVHLHTPIRKKSGQRSKSRTPNSRTMTKTKTEEKIHGDDIHSGITQSGYKIVVNKFVPKSVDPGKAWQYLEAATKVVTNAPGGQNAGTISFVGTIPQHLFVGNAGNTDVGADPSQSSTAYIKLNPNAANSGSAAWNVNNTPPITKYFYQHCGLTMRVANLTSAAAEVELIVLRCNQSNNFFPEDWWTQCAKNHGLNQFTSTPGIGGGGNTISGTLGYSASFLLDATPFSFKEYKKLWTPIKIHNINLAGAATEKVHFSIKMNQTVDVGKFIGMNNNYTQSSSTWTGANTTVRFPRGSIAIMAVMRGSLGKDTTSPGPAQGCCVPVGTEIGFYVTKHNYFQTINKTVQQLDPEIALYNTTAPTAANTKLINIVDVVSAVTSA